MSLSRKILIVAVVGGAAALFVLKPSPADVEDLVADEIAATILSSRGNDLLGEVALLACRNNLDECVRLRRATLDVTTQDRTLWQSVMISDGSRGDTTCIAALSQLWCR